MRLERNIKPISNRTMDRLWARSSCLLYSCFLHYRRNRRSWSSIRYWRGEKKMALPWDTCWSVIKPLQFDHYWLSRGREGKMGIVRKEVTLRCTILCLGWWNLLWGYFRTSRWISYLAKHQSHMFISLSYLEEASVSPRSLSYPPGWVRT